MAAVPTCAVAVRLYDQNAQAVAGATITAQLDRYEIHDGIVVPQTFEAVTDEFGECTLELWPNSLGSQSSSYKIKVQPTDAKGYSTIAIVPDALTANLSEIAQLPEIPGKTDFQDYFEQAQGIADDLVNSANAAKIAAQAAQAGAQESAVTAGGGASASAASAAEALASAASAQQSANAAAAALQNVASQAGAASAAAAAAAGSAGVASDKAGQTAASASAAATSEGKAAGSALAAAGSAASAATAKTAAEAARDLAQQYSNAVAPTVALPGDANYTTGRVVNTSVIYDKPITGPRTIALNSTNPVTGDKVEATRAATATGADVVDFGGLKYLNPGQWARATYNGTAWAPTGYGNL